MTCQWCIYYRRKRGGDPRCERPGGDGNVLSTKVIRASGGSHTCEWFEPRKSCTTCSSRCAIEYKEEVEAIGTCPKWSLRRLSTWGGSRRRKRKPPNESQVCAESIQK